LIVTDVKWIFQRMGILDVAWDSTNSAEEGLFPIFDNMESRVRVPKAVKSFDITMRREERDIEADYVFIVWLARKKAGGVFSDGSGQAISRDEGYLAVCSKPDEFPIINPEIGPLDIDDFFAELPLLEDYPAGEDDEGYQIDYVNSAIKIINAKNACKTCPLRAKCLADSILMGDEDRDLGANSNVRPLPGIWGGRELKDRKSIARRFKAIRNEYLSDEMSVEKKRMYERKAAQFIDDRP
jgi:hypothetical protein